MAKASGTGPARRKAPSMLLFQASKSQHGQSMVSGQGAGDREGREMGPEDSHCVSRRQGWGQLEEAGVWWEGPAGPGAVF